MLLLAGIQKRERDKLRQTGILSVDQLWNLHQEEIGEIIGTQYGEIAFNVAQADKTRRADRKTGAAAKNSPRQVAALFRFRNFRLRSSERTAAYLFDWLLRRQPRPVRQIPRPRCRDERRIFGEFFDYVGDPRDGLSLSLDRF